MNKPAMEERAAAEDWSRDDASELYRLGAWSDGFFRVNERGHIAVHPFDESDLCIDVMDVVEEAERRDITFPLLLRFQDVLRARVQRLNSAFSSAIDEAGYRNVYRSVYPIKVNQLHEVVEEVLDAGKPFDLGLECGSKAELVAALPHLSQDQTLLICNGVKDRTMLSLILAAQGLGKNVIPVMEKFAEFEQLMALVDEQGSETPLRRAHSPAHGGFRPLGGFRWLPLEVRCIAAGARRAGRAARTLESSRFVHPAAFPPGQPDRRHPDAQAGRQGDGADLCRTQGARLADPVLRRRRWARRQLLRRL